LEKKKSLKNKTNFENSLAELEKIVRMLEQGELGLEESIREFEQAMKLARYCHDRLEEAERKIEILQKGPDGSIGKKAVKTKDDTGEIDDDEGVQGSLL